MCCERNFNKDFEFICLHNKTYQTRSTLQLSITVKWFPRKEYIMYKYNTKNRNSKQISRKMPTFKTKSPKSYYSAFCYYPEDRRIAKQEDLFLRNEPPETTIATLL